MAQVRRCWKVAGEVGALQQAGPWMADTPFNRATLESVVEAGNYGQGVGTYWVEARQDDAETVAEPLPFEHPAFR